MPRPTPSHVASHSQHRVPNLVCAIDFGMTCTGVAYQKIPKNPVGHQPSPQVFRHWPGSAYNVDKVPTTIFYDADGHVTSWGLLTDEEPDQSKVTRLWKLALSTGGQLGPTSAIPLEEAEKHFTSYLKHLYQNLDEKFREWFPRDEYAEMVIEYLFSVPVTWSSPTVAKIERLIKSTSFGTARSCSAKVSLTEADAAAVDVIPERKVGDVVLVCDAGGGTSDIAVTKLLSDEDEPTKLKHLTKVMGNKCGSTHIDAAARQYLTGRLKEAFGAEKAAKTAATMVKGEFQVKKHDFGTPFSKERGCHLNVPGIGDGQNNSSAGIKDSKMEIPVSVLEGWFDDQAKGMIDLISGQLQATKTRFPDEKVKYLVFSGGLGKNLYIRDRLRRFVAEQRSFQSNANDLEVLLAEEPQLVVVRGLVKDRVQEICRGVVIFDMVCCRESYGMKTREEYDRKRHRGPEPEKDEKDGKRWVYNRIDWVIKQGESISREGIRRTYAVTMDDEIAPWSCVVVSTTADYLAGSTLDPSVHEVCKVDANLRDLPKRQKKQFKWTSAKTRKYEMVEFDLRVIIGAASLRFQIHGKEEGGKVISEPHPEVSVVFQEHQQGVEEIRQRALPFVSKKQ